MKGEEDKLFDDFLRKSVGNYQAKPSPGIWQNILQKLPARKIGRIPFSGGHSGLISIISGGVLITSVAIYNHNSQQHFNNTQPASSGALIAQTLTQKSTDSSLTNENINQDSILKPIDNTKPIITSQSQKSITLSHAINLIDKAQQRTNASVVTTSLLQTEEKTDALTGAQNEIIGNTKIAEPVSKNTLIPQASSITTPVILALNEENTNSLENLRIVQSDKSSYFTMLMTLDKADNVLNKPFDQAIKEMKIAKWKGDYANIQHDYNLGFYYHPEWLYNQKNSKYENNRQSFGLSAGMKKRPFILETGIGIMQEKAWQDYDVKFNQLLGTYNNLQTIQFDSIGGVVVPTYYYSTDSVYDPKVQQELHSHLAEYTYLQLPLFVGIEKSMGRNSFTIKGGPVFNLLLKKKEDKLLYSNDQKIISIAGDHPNRLTTSWQWYLGISYAYAITDNISFFFEPAVRGYLNTPYERKRQSTQNPIYVGIRAGIIFQLKNPLQP